VANLAAALPPRAEKNPFRTETTSSQYRRRRAPKHQLRRRDCGKQRGCANERERDRKGKPINRIDESPSERLFVYHENQQN